MHLRSLLVLLAVLSATSAPLSAGPILYTPIEIPPLNGFDNSIAAGISENGVVAFVSNLANNNQRNAAVRSLATRTSTDLGIIGETGGFFGANIGAISRNGAYIVGERIVAVDGAFDHTQAFRTLTRLDSRGNPIRFDLPGLAQNKNSAALGITDDDRTITGWANDQNRTMQGVLWEAATNQIRTTLKGLEAGGDILPEGGSVRGIIGTASKSVDGRISDRAVLWRGRPDQNTVPEELGNIGRRSSQGKDINLFGDIVGFTGGQEGLVAAFWPARGDPFLFGCGDDTEALAINDKQAVVGRERAPNRGPRRAMLWDIGAGDQCGVNLNDLINPRSGWHLSEAIDINDRGIIVGTGDLNGKRRAFVLMPVPEPSTLALLSMGTLSLLGYTWRRRKPQANPGLDAK